SSTSDFPAGPTLAPASLGPGHGRRQPFPVGHFRLTSLRPCCPTGDLCPSGIRNPAPPFDNKPDGARRQSAGGTAGTELLSPPHPPGGTLTHRQPPAASHTRRDGTRRLREHAPNQPVPSSG